MRPWPALALACVIVAGCAGAVPGQGDPSVDERADRAARTAEPEPSSTTTATATSAPPSATPTVGESDPALLACAAPLVMPPGSPYCYTVPGRLSAIDLGSPTAGEEGSFRTSYGFGPADHIDVQAYVVGVDTDGLPDDELVAGLTPVVADLEAGGFDFADEPERIMVDGKRGFVYPGTSTDGKQAITAHFVFSGVNEIQLNCARTERPVIDDACAQVLASMQVVG